MFAEIKRLAGRVRRRLRRLLPREGPARPRRARAALDRLREQGHVYEADGAIWLRTTDFGDDKDRVLVRSNGELTYFAADCAYYLDKRERGFDRVVIMLGADHHGYIGRMRAMAACFGDDPDRNLEILIGQMVNLVRDGQPVRMSKRAGTVITLDDLVDAIGVDAARYALARYSVDSPIDIDLDLWTRATQRQPGLLRAVRARPDRARCCATPPSSGVDAAATTSTRRCSPTSGRATCSGARRVPAVVATAAELREPHRVARYLEDLAGAYHRFYDACRVLPQGDEPVTDLHRARLWLVEATRVVLANGLGLLGVSAPERM